MSKRKIAAAFLAFALALSMTACGDDTASDSSTQTSSKSEITTTTTAPETTTTVSSSETTASSQTEKKSASEYTISCEDFSITIKDVNSTPGWQRSRKVYLEGKTEMREMCFDTELYTCTIGLVPIKHVEKLPDDKPKTELNVEESILEYKDKKVWCSKVYRNSESEKFVAGFMLNTPINDNYDATITIDIGGKYSEEHFNKSENMDYEQREEAFTKWFAENKDAYKDLSTDPNDYLFIFDALDMK